MVTVLSGWKRGWRLSYNKITEIKAANGSAKEKRQVEREEVQDEEMERTEKRTKRGRARGERKI